MIEVGLLGPLSLTVDGVPLDPGPAKQRCVLAVLAAEAGRVVPVDALVDRLWDEEPPAAARNVVQTYVARLRRALGAAGCAGADVLRFGSGGYRLAVARSQVDLFRFRELDARARVAEPDAAVELLREALGLVRGVPLAGLDGGWAARTRTHLEQLLLGTRRRVVELDLELGRHAEVLDELAELAAAHPLDEALAGLRMRALYGCGRPADALTVFGEIRERLVDEIGDEPGLQLRGVHEQVLRRDPALDAALSAPRATPTAWSARDDLPAPPVDFTGRADELARIAASSGGEHLAVIAVDGMAGVGKTSLALAAAHALADGYPDARLYLDLRGHTTRAAPLGPAGALDVLLQAAGVQHDRLPEDVDGRAAAWRARLAGRRVLLVLDNAADAAQVRPLLPGGPGSLVIVTSRVRLAGLAGAQALSLRPLPPEPARDLFDRVVGPAAAAEPEAVAELVALCGHLPLAITLAAARLRHRPDWTVARLLDRLRDATRLLRELRAGDAALAAVFETSYRELPPPLCRAFRLLGLLPGATVDVDAAAALCATGPLDTEDLLEELVDVHLLDAAPGGYRMHDLLRAFAVEVLARDEPADARDAAEERLFDHYAAVAETADPVWLDRMLPDLLVAVDRAAARGADEHVCMIAVALYEHLENRSRYADGEHLFTAAVASAMRLRDPAREAAAMRGLGVMRWRRGHFTDGTRHLTRSLHRAQAGNDTVAEALAHYHLGGLAVQAGRPGEAVTHYGAALALQRVHDDARRLGNTLNNLGVAHLADGDAAAAQPVLHEALDFRRQAGDVRGEVASLANLADARLAIGDTAAAVALLTESVALARTAGDRREEVAVLVNLGIVELARQARGTAAGCFARASSLVATLDDRYEVIATSVGIGHAWLAAGAAAEAELEFRAAAAAADELGAAYERAQAGAGLARALAILDKPGEAAAAGRHALATFERLGAPHAAELAAWLDTLAG